MLQRNGLAADTYIHMHTLTYRYILSRRNQENPKPHPKKTVGPTDDILDMHTYTHTRTYKAPKSFYVRMQMRVNMEKT